MIPVSREQLEGLHEALGLLRSARVDPPRDVFILARVRRDRLPAIRMAFLDVIENHFQTAVGMSREDAQAASDLYDLDEAAVRVPVTDETLHHILADGLVANRDEGLLRLSNGATLHVIYPRGLRVKVSYEESPTIMLAAAADPLEFYLQRVTTP